MSVCDLPTHCTLCRDTTQLLPHLTHIGEEEGVLWDVSEQEAAVLYQHINRKQIAKGDAGPIERIGCSLCANRHPHRIHNYFDLIHIEETSLTVYARMVCKWVCATPFVSATHQGIPCSFCELGVLHNTHVYKQQDGTTVHTEPVLHLDYLCMVFQFSAPIALIQKVATDRPSQDTIFSECKHCHQHELGHIHPSHHVMSNGDRLLCAREDFFQLFRYDFDKDPFLCSKYKPTPEKECALCKPDRLAPHTTHVYNDGSRCPVSASEAIILYRLINLQANNVHGRDATRVTRATCSSCSMRVPHAHHDYLGTVACEEVALKDIVRMIHLWEPHVGYVGNPHQCDRCFDGEIHTHHYYPCNTVEEVSLCDLIRMIVHWSKPLEQLRHRVVIREVLAKCVHCAQNQIHTHHRLEMAARSHFFPLSTEDFERAIGTKIAIEAPVQDGLSQ